MDGQNIRDETNPKQQEQVQDASYVFVSNDQEKTVDAVSDVDKDGNLKTVPADKKNQKNFMEVGHNSDVLDMVITALKNFKKQAGDPSHIGFVRISKNILTGIGDNLKETAKNFKEVFSGMFTEDADNLRNAAENNKNNNQKENKMAKQKNEQEPIGTNDNSKTYRILPGMVDWEYLRKAGLSKELLEKKGFLEDMLQGRKSPDTMNLNVNLPGIRFQGEGKISLKKEQNGTYTLRLHPVKQTPEFNTPYRGHVFTEEDKKNLLSTGNMGRVVNLEGGDFKMIPSVISLDMKTNEIHGLGAQHIYVPDEIAGVKLQKHEIDTLKAGGEVLIEGFKSKEGRQFDAALQIDAVDRRIKFKFDNEPGVYKKLGGVELSDDTQKRLANGETIRVDNMVRKNTGELYDAFVKYDPVANRINMTSYNPDTPEGAREIIIPKYLGGVKLEKEDRNALGRGEAVFIPNMVDRNGDSYDRFVKMHPESGRPMMSKFPDGFDENQKPRLDIPKDYLGIKITNKMRADLQDGKAVQFKNAKGTDGSTMNVWVKANNSNTGLNTYTNNPDEKKNTTKTAVIPQTPAQSEKKKSGQKM